MIHYRYSGMAYRGYFVMKLKAKCLAIFPTEKRPTNIGHFMLEF